MADRKERHESSLHISSRMGKMRTHPRTHVHIYANDPIQHSHILDTPIQTNKQTNKQTHMHKYVHEEQCSNAGFGLVLRRFQRG